MSRNGLYLILSTALLVLWLRETTAATAGPSGATCNRNSTSSAVTSAFNFLALVSNISRDYNADLTLDRVASLCRDGQLLKTSQAFIDKCVAMNVPGVHQLLTGSVKLLDVCRSNSQADIVTKIQAKHACEKKLMATVPTFANCLGQMSKVFDGLERDSKKPDFPSTGLQLSTVCCALKSYDDCLGQNYQKVCAGKSVQIFRNFLDGIYSAFNCFEEFSNCSI